MFHFSYCSFFEGSKLFTTVVVKLNFRFLFTSVCMCARVCVHVCASVWATSSTTDSENQILRVSGLGHLTLHDFWSTYTLGVHSNTFSRSDGAIPLSFSDNFKHILPIIAT